MSMRAPDLDGTVIGVVQDFNYESLHNLIIPIVTYVYPGAANSTAVRLAKGSVTEGVDHLKAVWNEFLPGTPVDITFLDERIDALYQSETRMMEITTYFSLIAVLIACLGLFGLATFMAERRTKEIGIRKVFGASGPTIMALLSKTFVTWVLVANFIAWPIAYVIMNRWQQDYAYSAGIGLDIFILATVATLLIAVASVSYQISSVARANPVDSIRCESG
jgi:putative ABC transport system permease protein